MVVRRASIVLADPDDERRRAIINALREAGLSAVGARHQGEAERLHALHRPALAIVDSALPHAGGLAAVRALQRTTNVPFILLSHDPEAASRIAYLAAGADDVIDQPADPTEVAIRARAVLRRLAQTNGNEHVLRSGELSMDASGSAAWLGDRRVPLTPDQSVLLRAFLESPGRVFTRAELAARLRAQATEVIHDETIDSQVRALRRKIEPEPSKPRFLLSVRGFGYRLAPEEERPPEAREVDLLRSALREVPTPLVLVDRERRLVMLNRTAEALTGHPSENLAGAKTCAELFRCRDPEGRLLTGRACPGLAALRGEEQTDATVCVKTPRGRQPYFSAHRALRAGDQDFILMTFEAVPHAS